ncbi:MAG: cupredoxin domain-containing protein [Thermomicrobiales bacterium]
MLDPGASFSYTFDEAGTFEYSCLIHPEMHGSIVVR